MYKLIFVCKLTASQANFVYTNLASQYFEAKL